MSTTDFETQYKQQIIDILEMNMTDAERLEALNQCSRQHNNQRKSHNHHIPNTKRIRTCCNTFQSAV